VDCTSPFKCDSYLPLLSCLPLPLLGVLSHLSHRPHPGCWKLHTRPVARQRQPTEPGKRHSPNNKLLMATPQAGLASGFPPAGNRPLGPPGQRSPTMVQPTAGVWVTVVSVVRGDRHSQHGLYAQALARLWDGVLVLVICLVAQLLIAGIEDGLDELQCPFPPAILAMLAVFAVMSTLGCAWKELEPFYDKHLRSAVSGNPTCAINDSQGGGSRRC
jgi:hypothetical protein